VLTADVIGNRATKREIFKLNNMNEYRISVEIDEVGLTQVDIKAETK